MFSKYRGTIMNQVVTIFEKTVLFIRFVSCDLDRPLLVRLGNNAGEVDFSCRKAHDKKHINPFHAPTLLNLTKTEATQKTTELDSIIKEVKAVVNALENNQEIPETSFTIDDRDYWEYSIKHAKKLFNHNIWD